MRKLYLKNASSFIASLCLVAFLTASCSSSNDNSDPDPIVEFTSLDASKVDVFTEETITLNLNGKGFMETNVTANNTTVKITKITNNIYEVSSKQATSVKVYAELKNNTYNQTKSIDLTFAEHGVKNFKTVEGITIDVDNSAKVVRFLGQPDLKTDSTDGLSEYWFYSSKVLNFIITKSNSIVNQANIFSSNFYFLNKHNVKISYANYPYDIGNGWKLNSSTTMDMVVAQLGAPDIKNSSSSVTTFQYTTKRIVFQFFSDSVDNYNGKSIQSFAVY